MSELSEFGDVLKLIHNVLCLFGGNQSNIAKKQFSPSSNTLPSYVFFQYLFHNKLQTKKSAIENFSLNVLTFYNLRRILERSKSNILKKTQWGLFTSRYKTESVSVLFMYMESCLSLCR